ncbi:substrate-binding periplasmic protein [Shewanella polaris]|uniref:substrate-binding periplasmic protein n=1 Tax=Shewanella polaris TaxID=2588449 RepID=UPI001F108D21|nr:transporter substrate-binding domain-containing protein [Shewanella polaris]
MKNSIKSLLIAFSSLIGVCPSALANPIIPIKDTHELIDLHAQNDNKTLVSTINSISFSTSNSIAPYFFSDTNTGVQYDLLKAALNTQSIEIKEIIHAPNLRSQRLVKTKKIDCMINTPDNVEGLFYTQSLIEYQNSLFYLSRNNLEIEQIDDLNGLSILGFQNSKQYLGDEFKILEDANPLYSEISNQKSQVVMLFNGYVQVIVLERRIFEYYRHLLRQKLDTSIRVTEAALFDPAERKIACHDQIIANQVNSAITALKQSYRYQEILDLAKQNNYQPQMD